MFEDKKIHKWQHLWLKKLNELNKNILNMQED